MNDGNHINMINTVIFAYSGIYRDIGKAEAIRILLENRIPNIDSLAYERAQLRRQAEDLTRNARDDLDCIKSVAADIEHRGLRKTAKELERRAKTLIDTKGVESDAS